jgi:hypothetical protein
MSEAPAAKTEAPAVKKVRLATMWLDGCSGCHMSLLDTDERLIALAPRDRSGLRAAGGYQGVPRERGRHPGGRAPSPAKRTCTNIQVVRARTKSWSRWAIAPSPATSPPCATSSARMPYCGAPTSRTPARTPRFRATSFHRCCPMRGRCTKWFRRRLRPRLSAASADLIFR